MSKAMLAKLKRRFEAAQSFDQIRSTDEEQKQLTKHERIEMEDAAHGRAMILARRNPEKNP